MKKKVLLLFMLMAVCLVSVSCLEDLTGSDGGSSGSSNKSYYAEVTSYQLYEDSDWVTTSRKYYTTAASSGEAMDYFNNLFSTMYWLCYYDLYQG